jgi:hypothetical protein
MKLLAQVLKHAAAIREYSFNEYTGMYKKPDSEAVVQAIKELGCDTRYQFPAEAMLHDWNSCMDWIDSILGTKGGA